MARGIRWDPERLVYWGKRVFFSIMKRAYEHSNQSFVLSASQTRRTSGNDLETTKNCKTEEFDLFAEIKTRSTRIDSFLFDCIRCFISCYMETEGFFFFGYHFVYNFRNRRIRPSYWCSSINLWLYGHSINLGHVSDWGSENVTHSTRREGMRRA